MFERLIDGFRTDLRDPATDRLGLAHQHEQRPADDGVPATSWDLDPEAVVISDEWQPMTSTRDAARLAKELPSAGSGAGTGLIAPEDLGPEVREALAKHVRNYEKQRLDMAIPALHSLTPQEAGRGSHST